MRAEDSADKYVATLTLHDWLLPLVSLIKTVGRWRIVDVRSRPSIRPWVSARAPFRSRKWCSKRNRLRRFCRERRCYTRPSVNPQITTMRLSWKPLQSKASAHVNCLAKGNSRFQNVFTITTLHWGKRSHHRLQRVGDIASTGAVVAWRDLGRSESNCQLLLHRRIRP